MVALAKPKFTNRGASPRPRAQRLGPLRPCATYCLNCGGSGTTLRRVGHELELYGHPAELGKRAGLHLLHRPASMHLHRSLGDPDIVGNLFAQAAASNLNNDLALPGTEGPEALPQNRQIPVGLPPCMIAREPELDGVEKVLIAERLGQELNRPPFHGLHGHRYVAVSRDEDDRNFPV